jgi:hypothetical protein
MWKPVRRQKRQGTRRKKAVQRELKRLDAAEARRMVAASATTTGRKVIGPSLCMIGSVLTRADEGGCVRPARRAAGTGAPLIIHVPQDPGAPSIGSSRHLRYEPRAGPAADRPDGSRNRRDGRRGLQLPSRATHLERGPRARAARTSRRAKDLRRRPDSRSDLLFQGLRDEPREHRNPTLVGRHRCHRRADTRSIEVGAFAPGRDREPAPRRIENP